MGNPRNLRKKYQTPIHPWQKERIEDEKNILREFGMKNKKSVWKAGSLLRAFKSEVKKYVASTTKQAEKEKTLLLARLYRLGLIKKTAGIDDVLGLGLRDILERRLQTIVYRQGLAKSMRQSRQFIVHGHITVGDKKVTVPAFLVPADQENKISFSSRSSLATVDNPERVKKDGKA
ncbi:MAG: 30S ribosomal protein S4 [archaeon]